MINSTRILITFEKFEKSQDLDEKFFQIEW